MSGSHSTYHPRFFEDHKGGRLSDATNTLDPRQRRPMEVPSKNVNGGFSQQTYRSNQHQHQQQQQQQQQQQYCNPAPYPPLPPAPPVAHNPAYLPLPPAPPLSWPSSCYSFSTPPAPAPYPPLPRAEAISPTSLNAEYAPAPASGSDHAFSRAAVELPLPAHAVAGLPQLVANYCSPVSSEPAAVRHRSVSPPPPLPPLPAADAQYGANPASPPPPPPPPRPPSMPASKDSSSSSRTENGNWVPPLPPGQWWQGPSRPPEEAAAVPLPDPRKTSTSSAYSSSRGGNSSGGQSSRGGKDYVIPKKKDTSSSRARDYDIPKKKDGRRVSDDKQKDRRVYSPETLRRYRDVKSSPEGATSSSSSSSSSANGRRGDTDRSQHSGGRRDTGGRAEDRVRWSEKEDRHKHRDRNGRDSSSRHDTERSTSGRGNIDGSDRHRRREGADRGSSTRPYGRSREYEDGSGGSRRGRWGERDDKRGRGVGRSCPPPKQRRDVKVVDLSTEQDNDDDDDLAEVGILGEVGVVDLSTEGDDDELAELTSQLTALELKAEQGEKEVAVEGKVSAASAGETAKAYLSLEEYKAATAKGEIKAYKGTKYQTVDARYADGWAYNPTTRRWVKVACQQKKNAMEALPALLARLELMENKDKLATQRSQLLETKVEKITKEKETGRKTVSLAMPTAPILVAFDTNWLIHHLEDTMCRVSDIAGRHADTSVLIPKEVLSELDRLKTRGKDQATRSSAQKANRYFRGLVERPLERGREFPVVRVQEDTELFRDKGHHSRPEGLGGDDSILNCCMFFTQGIDTPRKVTLVTGDNNFAIRASAHGLMTMGRPQCDPGHCRMPLCPAPPRPSPFSRGY